MLKGSVLITVFIVLSLTSTSNAQTCATVLTCAYDNTFNTATCLCDCFPNYSGSLCEVIDCTKPDPDQCASFGSYNCVVGFIKGYCPNLCGTCTTTTGASTTTTGASTTTTGASTTTTTDASTTTTTLAASTTTTTGASTTTTTGASTTTTTGASATTTTGASTTTTTGASTTTTTGASTTTTTDASTTTTTGASTTTTTGASTTTAAATTTCAPLACLNGYLSGCSCTCLSSWTGTSCTNINCSANDPSSCAVFSYSDCASNSKIISLCPKLCGVQC